MDVVLKLLLPFKFFSVLWKFYRVFPDKRMSMAQIFPAFMVLTKIYRCRKA